MQISEHQYNVFSQPTLKTCHLLHQLKSPSHSKACHILEHTAEIHSWDNELGSLMQSCFPEQRILIKAWKSHSIPQTLKQWGGRRRRLWKTLLKKSNSCCSSLGKIMESYGLYGYTEHVGIAQLRFLTKVREVRQPRCYPCKRCTLTSIWAPESTSKGIW